METLPSPALSVLKTTLESNGFKVDILYWNLRLNAVLRDFFNLNDLIYDSEYNKLLPFFSYLAIEHNDRSLIERIAYYILQIKPQLHPKGVDFIISELETFHANLEQIIDNYLKSISWSEYLFVGFSSLFYQWIVASIFVERLRKINAGIPIMIGGFNTRNEASAFMKNFSNFDYASWGEGEYSILQLSKYLCNTCFLKDVPHTIYRGKEGIEYSNAKNSYYDLDSVYFDFSDYMSQIKDYPVSQEISLPFEGGRGCHWQRCHFCYLNAGYKSRVKSVESIVREITAYINEYQVSTFLFLDNDIVGKDTERFDKLLDELINIKELYNDFSILGAEIITKDLSYEHIKKMGLIHFQAVQIGYESPSRNILTKIEKKNTFASNLFFLKWALKFDIKINGANVLKNLLEENTDDIKEGIDNLFYLRFYLSYDSFFHNHSTLSIARCSRYFKRLKDEDRLKEWNYSTIYNSLPKGIVNEKDKYDLILDFVKKEYNPYWDLFEKIEKHYLSNEYCYSLYENGDTILYRETYNGLIVNELEFERNGVHWGILTACNKKVQSINSLESIFANNEKLIDIEEIKTAVSQLSKEGILYGDNAFAELVSIINTDNRF